MELARCVARGAHWLGLPTAKGKRAVLYITGENSRRALKRRLRALCAGRDQQLGEIAPSLWFITDRIGLVPHDERHRVAKAAYLDAQLTAVKIPDPDRRASLRNAANEIAESRAHALGAGAAILEAIEQCGPDCIALIVVDTLRCALVGDDNSSTDAHRFMSAARELARALDAAVLILHHTSKAARGGQRSARGSVELTGSPDVLLLAEAGDDGAVSLTATLRNHVAPEPFGYRVSSVAPEGKEPGELTADERALLPVRVERCAVPTSKAEGIDDDEVLALYREHSDTGLTESKVRQLLSAARGNSGARSKVPAHHVRPVIERLAEQGRITPCTIGGKWPGHRYGSAGGAVALKRIRSGAATGDPMADFLSEGAQCDV